MAKGGTSKRYTYVYDLPYSMKFSEGLNFRILSRLPIISPPKFLHCIGGLLVHGSNRELFAASLGEMARLDYTHASSLM